MTRFVAFILLLSLVVTEAQPPVPTVRKRYVAAKVPKQASLLKPSVVVVPPAPSMWIGVYYGDTVEIQYCNEVNGTFSTIITTNAPVAWYQVPADDAQGFYRTKTTWNGNPLGCLVSTNAPSQ